MATIIFSRRNIFRNSINSNVLVMEFKGTKGKWEITDGHPNGEKINALRIQNDSVLQWDICAVWNDLGTEEEPKANALLISKAPEMLEMLRKLYANDLLKDNQNEVLELIKQATEL